MTGLEIFAVERVAEITRGDDLGRIIQGALERAGRGFRSGDVLVVAQKVVSKAEGAVVALETVQPSRFAEQIASMTGKDPRLVEVVLRESVRIVRMDRGVLITETSHGFVCANAGIDASNAALEGTVTTLPKDPDASAQALRSSIQKGSRADVAVIISDSFGRPWREGSVNVAIGVAGMAPLMDLRGQVDDRGRVLRTTVVAVADELASAAQLLIGEKGGVPAAVVRGFQWTRSDSGSASLKRPPDKDLFR